MLAKPKDSWRAASMSGFSDPLDANISRIRGMACDACDLPRTIPSPMLLTARAGKRRATGIHKPLWSLRVCPDRCISFLPGGRTSRRNSQYAGRENEWRC